MIVQARERPTVAQLEERHARHEKRFWDLDLSGRDLGERTWSGADFVNSDMRDVRLQGAHLRFVFWEGSNADRINVSRSDMSFSRGISMNPLLPPLSLVGARAFATVMQYSQFSRSDASGARLDGADATGTRFISTIFDGATFYRAVLADADLTMASVKGADFSSAVLAGAIGLQSVEGLETATFRQTVVTERQRDIILSRRGREEPGMFVVVDDARRR